MHGHGSSGGLLLFIALAVVVLYFAIRNKGNNKPKDQSKPDKPKQGKPKTARKRKTNAEIAEEAMAKGIDKGRQIERESKQEKYNR